MEPPESRSSGKSPRSGTTTLASPTTHSAAHANPSAKIGAKLDHSGRNPTGTQTTSRLANYPDAPPPSATAPQQSIGYYLDAPGATVNDHAAHRLGR